VSYISDRAFLGCNNLTSITLPDELNSIGNAVFAYCSNLQTISFPDSLTSIGDDIFIGTSITSIDISTNVTYIGYNSFVDEFTINYAGTQTQWDENELETNISGNFIVIVL
ncbi:leucine-rich repeat domain-containing protein, partial [Prochlorococcus marinus]|uniref:leucine-rich repeat domain-containing protein n=1 Tax=Prochlorococcus marinus TaxID=1219 RepID=UPI000A81298E